MRTRNGYRVSRRMKGNLDELLGCTLGQRYRLDRTIGSGGMGAVFEATQLDLGRKVAVKVLIDVDPRGIARLRREALTAGSLSCPHVVSIFDFQAPPGEPPFIVMELLPGHSLAQLLRQEPRLDVPRAARIAAQMLIGLEAAHRAEIVHRDVKPSNTWLVFGPGIDEHVKMLDFGIAKMLAEGAPVLTTTSGMLGTPAYLAPEQLRGFPADARVDIHAMGVVLFEMIAGRRPWQAEGPGFLIEIIERIPPLLHEIAPQTPPALSQVVARALAKDPAARFARADDLRLALEPFVGRALSLPPTVVGGLSPATATWGYGPPAGPPSAGPTGEYSVPSTGWNTLPGAAHSVPSTMGMAATILRQRPHAPLPLPVATAPSTSRPPRSLALPLVVVAFFVALGLAGVLIAVLVAHERAVAPVAEAGPPPRTSASATPAGDAGDVVASASVDGRGAAPPAPIAARTTASRGGRAQRCECETPRGGTICTTTKVPNCACHVGGSSGFDLCPQPFNAAGTCPVGAPNDLRPYSAPGRKNGEPCSGFEKATTGKNTPASGLTSCTFCYGHEKFASTDGAVCRGIDKQAPSPAGPIVEGRAVCDK
jgi:serine/threonine protein kinase